MLYIPSFRVKKKFCQVSAHAKHQQTQLYAEIWFMYGDFSHEGIVGLLVHVMYGQTDH